jgi:ribosomal protein S18 acetylase RimI-like enzyme
MAIYLKNQLSQEQVCKDFKNTNTSFYFAYCNEALVGYLKLNFNEAQTEAVLKGEGYEIERIYILKSYQDKRLGSQLLEKAIKIGRFKGYKLMWLGVWELNFKALKFYKKKRLEVFDSHNFQFGDEKQTDILMKLKI